MVNLLILYISYTSSSLVGQTILYAGGSVEEKQSKGWDRVAEAIADNIWIIIVFAGLIGFEIAERWPK